MTDMSGPTIITIKVDAEGIFTGKVPALSIADQIVSFGSSDSAASGIPDIKDYCCVKDNQDHTSYVCGAAIKTLESKIYPDSHVLWQGALEPGQKSDYTLQLDLCIVDLVSSEYFEKVIYPGSGTHILAFTRETFNELPEEYKESYFILLTVALKSDASSGKTFVLDPILKGIYR